MRHNEFVTYCVCMALVTAALFSVPGCDKKLPDQAKAFLATGALAANERATAFETIRPHLTAKDGVDKAALASYLKSHGEGLNAQAKGLADIVEALKAGSNLDEKTRDMIAAEAETASVRAVSFILTADSIAGSETVTPWIEAHGKATKSGDTKALEKRIEDRSGPRRTH